jgi:putative membrane protein
MSALSKPLKTLSNLLQSQEEEATSRQLSSVSWYKDVFRISGSAIHRVWKAVIIFTVWSCVISVAQDVYGRDLTTSSSVIPIISVVVGLLLVFRNSSAFARWEDGRRTFGAMSAAIRNIARYTWVNVGASTYDSSRDSPYKHANWTEADQQAKVQAMRREFWHSECCDAEHV